MTVMITGGTGFVGVAAGHDGLMTAAYGQFDNQPAGIAIGAVNQEVCFQRGNCQKVLLIRVWFPGPIHRQAPD